MLGGKIDKNSSMSECKIEDMLVNIAYKKKWKQP